MMCLTTLVFLFLIFDITSGFETHKFRIFRIGDENNLGTGSDVDGPDAEDYVLIKPKAAIDEPLPRQMSFCFNMFYLTMDHWSANQKTILNIFRDNDEATSNELFLRINNSPPRGTMIVNSGGIWSGGLGDYRYEDLAFQRWSSICMSLDFELGFLIYYIDGRKVADQELNESLKRLFRGESIPWPLKIQIFKDGENMVGDITNMNAYSRLLTKEDMERITTCKLHIDGDYINWKNDSIIAVGNYTKERIEDLKYSDLCKPSASKRELFAGKKSAQNSVTFCEKLRNTMPLIQDETDYSEFDKYVQRVWEKYPKVSEICYGFLVLPQAMEERNGQYPVDPFTNSIVEFSPWAQSEPSFACTQKGIYGIAVNMNHTDTFDDGYYCIDKHPACLFVRL